MQIKLSTSPSHSILTPGQPVPAQTLEHQVPGRVATGVPIFKSLVSVDPEKSWRKWDLNPGSSALEVDALTTKPPRRSHLHGSFTAQLSNFGHTDQHTSPSSQTMAAVLTQFTSHFAPMGSPSRGGGVSRLSLPTPFSPIFVCPSAYRNLSPVLLFTHQLLPTYLQFSSSDCPFCLHQPFTYISLLHKPSFCHFSFSHTLSVP